jgi:hypothetical protein
LCRKALFSNSALVRTPSVKNKQTNKQTTSQTPLLHSSSLHMPLSTSFCIISTQALKRKVRDRHLQRLKPPARPHQPAHNHALTDGSTPSPSPSGSSTSSSEPPAAGPSSLAGVWRVFSLAISRDPAAQRFRNSHTQPGRRHHSSAAIIHGLMIRSDSRQPAISRHSSRFSHMRSVAPMPL